MLQRLQGASGCSTDVIWYA